MLGHCCYESYKTHPVSDLEPVSPLLSGPTSVMRTVLGSRDAVWDISDPLPFFLLPHLQIPSQLVTRLAQGEAAYPWTIVNYCLGQLR